MQVYMLIPTILLQRLYAGEGCYLVTVADGTKLEGFDETLRPRQCFAIHSKCKTAAWRGTLYSAPKPVLARADDSRTLATSIMRATYPEDLYWSTGNNWEKQRELAKVKFEEVGTNSCSAYTLLDYHPSSRCDMLTHLLTLSDCYGKTKKGESRTRQKEISVIARQQQIQKECVQKKAIKKTSFPTK